MAAFLARTEQWSVRTSVSLHRPSEWSAAGKEGPTNAEGSIPSGPYFAPDDGKNGLALLALRLGLVGN